MSPPTTLKDNSGLNDKRFVRNNQSRTFGCISSRKIDSDQRISDLLEELQGIMVENSKLQSTNKTLKSTVYDLQIKYNDLMDNVNINKSRFETDLNKLQDEIKQNEQQLIENSKRCMQEEKKHVQEIRNLQTENEKLHIDIAKKETEFMEKIKNLESEVKLLQLNYNNARSLNEENAQKSTKYKNKLKYAITIINDLNTMLAKSTIKPNITHEETQTEETQVARTPSLHSTHSCTAPQQQLQQQQQQQNHHLETEKLLLSEVFFKSKAFCDNEILIFNEKEPDFEDYQEMKLDI